MKKILTYLMSLIFISQLYAQEVNIIGKVTDANSGEALPGVNIVVAGTTTGVVTNLEGAYAISAAQGNTLVFSFMGYLEENITVGAQTNIDVQLVPALKELEEVVVVGYGSMNKSDLTGSVATVDVNNASESGVTSVNQLLQGRSPGVNVRTNSGVPGGDVSVNIRGVGSMSASTQPLYVIDGVIIDEDPSVGNSLAERNEQAEITKSNPLNFISPDDIASIEILKDASATAIYGSRGANGVVLISTKQGEEGKTVFTYDGSVSASRVYKKIDVLDGEGYANYRIELSRAYGYSDTSKWQAYLDTGILDINWQDMYFGTGISQKHRISASGGKDGSTFFYSLGYLGSEGIIDNTGFTKYDFRTNIKRKLNDRVTFRNNLSGSFLKNNNTKGTSALGGDRSMVGSIIFSRPLENDDLTEDGTFDKDEVTNSPATWEKWYKDNMIEKAFNSKFELEFKLFDWLSYSANLGVNYRAYERRVYYGMKHKKGDSYDLASEGYGGRADVHSYDNFHLVTDHLLQIKKKVNDHRFNGTIGVTYDDKLTKTSKLKSEVFIDDYVYANALESAVYDEIERTGKTPTTYASGLFRINYNYKALGATVTGRADGSSKFAEGNRWGFFPSVALAYKLHQLQVIKNIQTVSNLKLRLGWGRVGNSKSKAYATQTTYNYSVSTDASGEFPVFTPRTIGNPDLTWETAEQYNIGLDLGVFKNRITLTVEAYQKLTKDQLQNIALPAQAGYSNIWVNNGIVENKGLELDLNIVAVDRNFKAEFGGNIAFNRNSIKEIGLDDYGESAYLGDNLGGNSALGAPLNKFVLGEPVGTFWGFKTDGIMQEDSTVSVYGIPVEMLGNVNVLDLSGPNGVPDSVINEHDKTVIGDPNPDFIYGFYVDLGYKNLTLDLLFQGVYGRKVFNMNSFDLLNHDDERSNKLAEAYYDAWTPDNPGNKYPRLDMTKEFVAKARFTDNWVEDATYFRLSNVNLAYTIMTEKNPVVNKIKLYASVNNVFTLTKYTGFDPEVDSFSGNPLKVGIDQSGYPAIRTYLLGVRVTFK